MIGIFVVGLSCASAEGPAPASGSQQLYWDSLGEQRASGLTGTVFTHPLRGPALPSSHLGFCVQNRPTKLPRWRW